MTCAATGRTPISNGANSIMAVVTATAHTADHAEAEFLAQRSLLKKTPAPIVLGGLDTT
jgi:hypothetical protein